MWPWRREDKAAALRAAEQIEVLRGIKHALDEQTLILRAVGRALLDQQKDRS